MGITRPHNIKETNRNAKVYEYRGKGASGDIVARVKKHHADENDLKYHSLTARKIASGGKEVRITLVVVIEGVGP